MKILFQRIINKIKTIMCIIRYRNPKNSELYKHAKHELDILLESLKMSNDPSDYKEQKKLNKSILKCVEAFCTYGHSGFSAQYAINNLIKLLHYEPIMPLTGCNHEWVESYRRVISNTSDTELVYQNKRYFSLFKKIVIDKYGEKIKETFEDINIPKEEWKDITFPYLPGDTSSE